MNVRSVEMPWLPYALAVVPAVVSELVSKRTVPIKRLAAAFLYGAILAALMGINAEVAVAFAWVGALTSLLINGQVLFSAIEKTI